MQKACRRCGGRPSVCGHPQPTARNGSTRASRALHLATVSGATACWRCGEGPRADDPFVAGHIVDHARGGMDTADNLAPEHRSCNARAGGAL